MHKKNLWLTAVLLTAGLTVASSSMICSAEDIKGELVFAQCNEYVNIRSEASEDSDVVAKIYNHSAALVTEKADDNWYKVKSGNAIGYVKAEYFATGEQADAIANDVAYNVAVVNAKALNVRTSPSEESSVVDVAEQNDELEVVAYDGGWMTVALGNDVYGFVSPDYCEYKTYYPTAITLEEEAAANQAAQAHTESIISAADDTSEYIEESTEVVTNESAACDTSVQEAAIPEDTYTDSSYTEDTAYADTSVNDGSYTEDPSYTDTSASDTSYTENNAYAEDASSTDASYTDSSYTDGSYTDSSYTDSSYTDSSYTDSSYTEDAYTDPSASDDTITDDSYYAESDNSYSDTSASANSALGQQIADYGVQFVGNPYVYGGTSLTNGADCSGFTQSVMAQFGIYLARTAADQAYGGTSISVSDVQPGDLLFYSEGSGISHVGIYIGGGQIVHASTESTGIIISSAYYSSPVAAARYW